MELKAKRTPYSFSCIPLFLMYRMELKLRAPEKLVYRENLFLMYRMELKAGYGWSISNRQALKFLMYRMELKVWFVVAITLLPP